MQKITPFLWFDNQAEEAVNFYLAIFKDGEITKLKRNEDGAAFIITFRIHGQEYMALNGGPGHPFTDALSLVVNCESQEEIDYFWDALSAGGEIRVCGWLRDKYGFSWQIVPSVLGELMSDPDPVKTQRVMDAVLGMKKLEIAELQRAYEGS